jgi:hypothetical protein
MQAAGRGGAGGDGGLVEAVALGAGAAAVKHNSPVLRFLGGKRPMLQGELHARQG